MENRIFTGRHENFDHRGVTEIPAPLGWAFPVLGMVAPILLVIYAFSVSDDAPERASIIIDGCRILVLMLASIVASTAFYRLGVNAGLKAARYAMGEPVPA
jgi:hypothetical protein